MGLTLRDGYDSLEQVRALFAEYTDMLIAGDRAFQTYLELQNYEDELAHLKQKYGRPDGRLYLAEQDGVLAGCIALRRLNETRCEMKRLYVRPAFRGLGIARTLVERLLQDARETGYQAMLLDTLPFLDSAIRLYRTYGFYEIGCYNNSPLETSIYMQKDL